MRRQLVLAFSLMAAVTPIHAAQQQRVYPVKPIRMIVAVPPGGPADTLSRYVSPKLTEALGQVIVIDNQSGANGNIAYEMTARAVPDGYTIAAVAQAGRYEVEAMRLREALARMWREDRYVRLVTDGGKEVTFASALMSSWPALSGAADFERAHSALQWGLAVLEQDNMVLLLHPPFTEASEPHPGKIADYPPGVRENAGQYSHGASWLVDALTKLGDVAAASGNERLAAELRAHAVDVWIKISPIEEYTRERLDTYGLPPHQQPADVYFGDGYSGRGGWSWYTGAAARMLTAAHGILGLQFKDGQLVLAEHVGTPKGRLRLRRVVHRGQTIFGHP